MVKRKKTRSKKVEKTSKNVVAMPTPKAPGPQAHVKDFQFILDGKQLDILLQYLHTKPYNEVKTVIPQLMALPKIAKK